MLTADPAILRPVSLEHYTSRTKLAPVQNVWIRATGALPDELEERLDQEVQRLAKVFKPSEEPQAA